MKTCPHCFRTLSDRNRMAIVLLLQKGERRVNDLVKRFNIGQPTVSHHLAQLKKEKMVRSEKKGREIFYFLNQKYPCKNCNIFIQLKLK